MGNDIEPKTDQNEAETRLKRRQQAVVEAVVWDAVPFLEAAKNAGYSRRQSYRLLKNRAVLAALRAERQVLLGSERAKNVQTLIEIRDSSPNALARVQAVKELERLAAEGGGARSPGDRPLIVIDLSGTTERASGVQPLSIDLG